MAFLDIHNNEIAHHPSFPNDEEVINLEIGAGRNFFGKKFFPNCYLTEDNHSDVKNLKHFKELDDYNEESKCHFIDSFRDLYSLKGLGKTFNRIICCNPFEYGFANVLKTINTLNTLGELLTVGGHILIMGNNYNKWSKRDKFDKYYIEGINDINYRFEVSDYTVLDDNHRFVVDHTYYRTCMEEPVRPTYVYSIKKIS